ncbi:hypothetical protein EST38_g2569 [Candolleomyces aberdarensis]|uniref:PH domain-containing protein n=1 Tax=Candolleomyces aberdarensis TaxID=2316362 RepID=A0A4Q2DV93_9AGAR|nr:hypothetical protein EST38_g2569 [Candolleomyces aberdarensis]
MGFTSFAGSSQPPLSSIAEARAGSGEDSDEDEPADSGWKTPDHRSKPRASGEDNKVIKSGYLWKKGERRKTWKKRWFVLRPAHLAYYKSSAEYQLLRLLDLSDIHSCTPVNLKRHDNTFGLISPNRTFYFQATSSEDVQDWVKAIEEARQTLLATSTQNSASTPIPIVRAGEPVTPQMKSSLLLSSSPGQLAVTSSDSEDGGQVVTASSPPAASYARGGGGVSAPSPTAVNFLLNPTKPSAGGAASTTAASSGTVTTSSGAKVILTGYLMKCGSKRRNWRKRWFVLTPEKLLYSGSHMIVTTKRNLLLCAPTEDDEIKWLGAIRALIARRSGSGVVPGKTSTKQLTTSSVTGAGGAGGGAGGHAQEASAGSTAAASNVSASAGGPPPPNATGTVRSRTRRLSAGQSEAEGRG